MPTVLIIDDHTHQADTLSKLIESVDQYLQIESFSAPDAALRWLRWHSADLILTEYRLQSGDGIEFIRRIRAMATGIEVPIVMLASADCPEALDPALDAGATDFLTLPLNPSECIARCRNLLTQQAQRKIIQDRARWLEKRVAETTTAIRLREHETLLRLAKAGEYRDEDTGNHVIRMAKYSRLIAEHMGLPTNECEIIELAAPMHDIGKIGITDAILRKAGPLTPEEFEVMKTHTEIGYNILKDSPSEYLQLGAIIARGHHERFDGNGYPFGHKGDEIPLAARIVALADAYDALTSERPYKPAWQVDEAIKYINGMRGAHFDPDCVDALNAQLGRVMKIQYLLRDNPVRARDAR